MATTITLLRHCEATHNLAQQQQQQRDTPLTERGREQARALHGHYDLVWCSPLRRCRETLAESGITFIRCEHDVALLREHITEECDLLLTEEEGRREAESDFDARVAQLRLVLAQQQQGSGRMLLVTHADLIWRLTANGGEFGQWLENGAAFDLLRQ